MRRTALGDCPEIARLIAKGKVLLTWSVVTLRLSDNVVPVKYFLGVLARALRRARHSLSWKVLPYQPRPARNPFQVRNSVRPMHLFGHTFDHDYYFELPREEGAGYPINYSMFDFTPWRCPGCPACLVGPTAREIS
jgi:hypothetical protein